MTTVSAPLYRFKDLVAEALKKLEAIKEERVKKVSVQCTQFIVQCTRTSFDILGKDSCESRLLALFPGHSQIGNEASLLSQSQTM